MANDALSVLMELDEFLSFNEKVPRNILFGPITEEQLNAWRDVMNKANIALGRMAHVYTEDD